MNIINKTFLKLALLPSGLYRKAGVNIYQLRSILYIKLTMDDRRPGTLQQVRSRKSDKPITKATLGMMFLSALMGLLYLISFLVGNDPVTQLTVYFSFFFFMLSATLISDFTSVLIDIRDNYIILTRPVSDRTFIVARLLHIFIHICKMVVPMAIPGLVKMLISYGAGGGLLFLLMVLFVALFSIFFINAVYIIILRITTPRKFQSIISYVQIIFAILVYASYQVLPRMISMYHLEEFDISRLKWATAFPLYWIASAWNVLFTFSGTTSQIIVAIAGILLPFASMFIVIKYLAPTFNNKLALINSSGEQDMAMKGKMQKNAWHTSYSYHLARIFTRNVAEKMGFVFTWKMTARSRDFKLKVYPSIGYLLVYVVIMFINKRNISLDEIAAQETQGKIIVISALYFTSLLLTMALNQIVFSEKFRASWIYFTAPLQRPGEVILGAAKAAIFKFYIPMVFFITIAGVSIVGIRILPNIILGLFNELLIASCLVFIGHKTFPFSLQQNNNEKGGSILNVIAVMFISVFLAFGHYLIYDITMAVILSSALSIIATWLLMGSIKRISWNQIRSSYHPE
jgi:ABC-2 type transport system permease protein